MTADKARALVKKSKIPLNKILVDIKDSAARGSEFTITSEMPTTDAASIIARLKELGYTVNKERIREDWREGDGIPRVKLLIYW